MNNDMVFCDRNACILISMKEFKQCRPIFQQGHMNVPKPSSNFSVFEFTWLPFQDTKCPLLHDSDDSPQFPKFLLTNCQGKEKKKKDMMTLHLT